MFAASTGPCVFITGTDTGVGKTIVTATLAYFFTSKGLNVGVMKPFETGVHDTTALGHDGELLRWAADSKDPADLISPYRLTLPASPHQAAIAENVNINLDDVYDAFNTVKANKDIVLVEGAGGLMVPLRGGFLMADMVKKLNTPALVVTHPRLGTLNHTLLTTFSARVLELELSGLIVNRMPDVPDAVENEAPHLLASLASADLLGVLPDVQGADQEKVVKLAATLESLPTYHWLLSAFNVQL